MEGLSFESDFNIDFRIPLEQVDENIAGEICSSGIVLFPSFSIGKFGNYADPEIWSVLSGSFLHCVFGQGKFGVCSCSEVGVRSTFLFSFSSESTLDRLLKTITKINNVEKTNVLVCLNSNQVGEKTLKKHDLIFFVLKTDDSYQVVLRGTTQFFTKPLLERLASSFVSFVTNLSSEQLLHETHLLSPEEINQQLTKMSGYSRYEQFLDSTQHLSCSVFDRFTDIAEQVKTQIAVETEPDNVITYGQLLERTLTFSEHLRTFVLSNKSSFIASRNSQQILVAVMMERNIDWITALLSVLKLGFMYVPLDPILPLERVKYIIERTGCSALITSSIPGEDLVRSLPDFPIISFNELFSFSLTIEDPEKVEVEFCAKPDSNAYLVFTSGTTGKPKGIAIPHRSLVNFAITEYFAIFGSSDPLLGKKQSQIHSISFDASLNEVFVALLNGTILCIVSEKTKKSPETLADWVMKRGISVFGATASSFKSLKPFFYNDQDKKESVAISETIILAGEKNSRSDIEDILIRKKATQVINGYGPSEGTCLSHFKNWKLNDVSQVMSNNVGIPFLSVIQYILSPFDQLLPVGIPGELCISGIQVPPKGYYLNDNKEDQSYVSNPFHNEILGSSVMYRTGDLARYVNEGGDVEILKRLGGFVKIRGFRVECSHVEQVVKSLSEVDECFVITDRDSTFLIAFVIISGKKCNRSTTISSLKKLCQDHLPHYMIPRFFLFREEVSMNINNKVDRKALLSDFEEIILQKKKFVSPSNIEEEKVLEIMKSVLFKEEEDEENYQTVFGMEDGFHSHGGNSMLLTLLLKRLVDAFDIPEFSYTEVMEVSVGDFSCKNLCELMDRKRRGEPPTNKHLLRLIREFREKEIVLDDQITPAVEYSVIDPSEADNETLMGELTQLQVDVNLGLNSNPGNPRDVFFNGKDVEDEYFEFVLSDVIAATKNHTMLVVRNSENRDLLAIVYEVIDDDRVKPKIFFREVAEKMCEDLWKYVVEDYGGNVPGPVFNDGYLNVLPTAHPSISQNASILCSVMARKRGFKTHAWDCSNPVTQFYSQSFKSKWFRKHRGMVIEDFVFRGKKVFEGFGDYCCRDWVKRVRKMDVGVGKSELNITTLEVYSLSLDVPLEVALGIVDENEEVVKNT